MEIVVLLVAKTFDCSPRGLRMGLRQSTPISEASPNFLSGVCDDFGGRIGLPKSPVMKGMSMGYWIRFWGDFLGVVSCLSVYWAAALPITWFG